MSSLNLKQLKQKLEKWYPQIAPDEFNLDHIWVRPVSDEHGIFTTNLAFRLAKTLGQKPLEIAKELETDLTKFLNATELPLEAVTVGPYVNLKLKSEFYTKFINSNPQQDYPKYLQNEIEKTNQKILLDYISPNAAKPLHAGHVRNADIGESLRRLLILTTSDLITDNHWGDWGVQFGIMFWGWKQLQQIGSAEVTMNGEKETINTSDYETDPIDFLVKVYVWANQNKESVPDWEKLVRDEFIKLEEGDEENRGLWKQFLEVSQINMREELKLLNVAPHDLEQGESHYEKDMRELTEFLEKNNIWKKEGSARYFEFEELAGKTGLEPDISAKMKNLGRCYLISSNGYTSYAYRDLATRWNWARDHKRDLVITVTGNEQVHHFQQVFAIVAYLLTLEKFKDFVGEDVANRMSYHNLVHISYGFLNLPEGKMSTRRGNILRAKDLIGQIVDTARYTLLEKNPETPQVEDKSVKIGIAALKWFDLNRDTTADIVLNVPQILSFEGNTGVYQLYTYARLRSVLRKASISDLEQLTALRLDHDNFDLTEREKLLLQKVFTFPETVQEAANKFKPHLICTHLYELATGLNQWYNDTPILKEENSIRRQTLLKLIEIVCENLRVGLDLLAIEVLGEM